MKIGWILMFIYLMLFIQLLALMVGILILLEQKMTVRSFLSMFILTQGLGFWLYPKIGIGAIFFILIFIILFLFVNHRNYIMSLAMPCLVLILFVMIDHILQVVGAYLFGDTLTALREDSYFILVVVGKGSLFTIALCLLVKYIFRKFQVYRALTGQHGKVMVVFLLLTLFIFYLNVFMGQYHGIHDGSIKFNSILFLIYTVLLGWVMATLLHTKIKDNQIECERIQNEQLRKYTEELELQNDEVRKFRHDYINLLLTMSEYLVQKDMEGLIQYFSEKITPVGERFQVTNYQLGKLSKLKRLEVKGIVANKVIQAQNLDFQINIEIAESIYELSIDTMSLCRSLGIILDNAIEGAQMCEIPVLDIAFITLTNSHLIVVKNSYCGQTFNIEQFYENGFSTKGKNRGLGLGILREIIEQYDHIHLSTYIKTGYFIQEIEIEKVKGY